ncbi:unnamed protein product [Medioppia subpectinata]|uniref:Uncharacterized protein n=1 Tax=Medioppia subpectinata TaxID=1979941 RepID=A0A7R9KTX3_9ACAR|nr:unnamed protein product [Medioppia subpectinata]CAG2109744.1 unnamed protein product [Medioppia subpectinata]
MSHQSHDGRQLQKQLQQNPRQMQMNSPLKPYPQNSFQTRSTRYPQIIANDNHLRIQSPFSKEEEFDEIQSLDNFDEQNHNLRHFDGNHKQRNNRQNIAFNHQNSDPIHDMEREIEEQNRRNYRNSNVRPNPYSMGMKMVLPKNREESKVHGFEAFSSDVTHEEKDKFYPKTDELIQEFPQNEATIQSEEPSEDYLNAPENEVEYQRHLNFFPPVISSDEEERRVVENYRPFQQQSHKSAHNFGNQFKQSEQPNQHYRQQTKQRQQNQNKANHQNIQNYGQNAVQRNNPYESINVRPLSQPFRGDRDPNEDHFRTNHINKQTNQFVPIFGNNLPKHLHKTTKRPKEIAIVREITRIIPSDELHNADESHDDNPFDSSPIATPTPPELPDIYMPFEDRDEDKTETERPEVERDDLAEDKPEERPMNLGKEENFYDDEETVEEVTEKPKEMDIDEETNENSADKKNKFAKEVDVSADDLEKYFDREFANENLKDEEGQQKIMFDDEFKESNQQVAKHDKTSDEDTDVEADYKTSGDFLKNHDNFLSKIEKENDKFRQRTESKVEDDDSDKETETDDNKTGVDTDVEKELDGEGDKKDNTDEESDDSKETDKKEASDESNDAEEEEKKDSTKESESKATEVEDDEESESKEVSEKEEKKDTENGENETKDGEEKEEKEDNDQKNTEEDKEEEDSDKEKSDNKGTDETSDEKVVKTVDKSGDKCNENNCDKELLKQESKESKNTQQLGAKEDEMEAMAKQIKQQLIGRPKADLNEQISIELKAIGNKLNKTLRISQSHNFAPFFIDLKRINPNTKKAIHQNV